jgi:hypothetical protein
MTQATVWGPVATSAAPPLPPARTTPTLPVPDGPTFEIVTVTPDMAKAMLAGQQNIRLIRKTRIAAYAEAMKAGMWSMTAEPITYNGSRLLNGFHRLNACIKADAPFTVVVARGIPAEAVSDMDSGLARTAGDALRERGIPNGEYAASVARLLIAWDEDFLGDTMKMSTISRPRLIRYVRTHTDDLHAAFTPSGQLRSAVAGSRAAYAAVFTRLDVSRRAEFFASVTGGETLSAGDPRLALRRWLLNRSLNSKRAHAHTVVAQMVKAWNMWLAGIPTQHLKASEGMAIPPVGRP